MDFQRLQARLLEEIRRRVRNGEMTERSLGRITGISQPHIHNVLKGVRVLSLDMADHVLRSLRIDLADLLAGEGATPRERGAIAKDDACFMVEVLDGYIGPGHPYPRGVGSMRYPFPAAAVKQLRDPVAARLAPPHCGPMFDGGGTLLLDRSPAVDTWRHEEAYFALDLGGASTIGLMRAAEGLCLWNRQSGTWESVDPACRNPLDLVRGRVSLLVRHL